MDVLADVASGKVDRPSRCDAARRLLLRPLARRAGNAARSHAAMLMKSCRGDLRLVRVGVEVYAVLITWTTSEA